MLWRQIFQQKGLRMFIAMNRFEVKPEVEQAFETLLRRMVTSVAFWA